MYNPLSSKGFLQVGGVVLIIVGILSYLPFTNNPGGIFGPAWWFDAGEGVAHIFLGVVAIAAAYALPDNLQKPLVVVVGIVGLLFGVLGGTVINTGGNANFYGLSNLESPLDNILHLFVAAWALYASLVSKATPESKMM
jgi:hypothetical protein